MATIWAQQALLDTGWHEQVGIDIAADGTIGSIRIGIAAEGYRTGILLPAPVNVHSHAFQRAMAGLTESRGPNGNDSFWTWRQWMFRFLEKLTPEHVEAIGAQVQMEMLEAGFAANVEFHYLHHQPSGLPYQNVAEMAERIAAATALTGIGLTLLPVHYQFGGCDRRPLASGQKRFGNTFEQFTRLFSASAETLKRLPPDCAMGVAPHSLRAVAKEDLNRYRSLAEHGPLHMHLAEQLAEVEEVLAAYGKRPVELVLDSMDLGGSCCLIHCTQMLPHETMGLAGSGVVAGLCPITEASLGDGVFDAVRWMTIGGQIAIGSDSNIRISLMEELRALEYSQRLRDHSRAALATKDKSTGRNLLDAINTGGAHAAGRNSGCIAIGKLADLVALDSNSIHTAMRKGDAVVDSFVFAGDPTMITDVWSAGRHCVRQGRHIHRDSILAGFREVLEQMGSAI